MSNIASAALGEGEGMAEESACECVCLFSQDLQFLGVILFQE